MKETLISFETAKLAKEKGFDEKCPNYYVRKWGNSFVNMHGKLLQRNVKDDQGEIIGFYKASNSKGQPHLITAPTQSLLLKWLREVHNIHITIYSKSHESWMYRVTFKGQSLDEGLYGEDFENYEEALEDGLLEALKLIK